MTLALQGSFEDLSVSLYHVTFCILDLETTGGSPKDCGITEVGAVKFRGGEEIGSFQTLVNPGAPIPPFITVLTGITQTMVVEAPRVDSVLPAFLEFVGTSVVVGHNIRFDLSFLDEACRRLGYPTPHNETVDTVALARRLVRNEVRNLRLQSLAAHFRSPIQPVHRALEDARATAHVLHSLLERAGGLGVTTLEDLLRLPKAKGSSYYAKISLTSALPRRPGVYIFRDRSGEPIYIGKAGDLRSRVRQYFYGDERRSIGDLMRELHSIDHVVCQTGLEAEVTELRLIHAHRPRHNRRSKPPRASHYVKLTSEAFPRLSVVRSLREPGMVRLGPFRSRRAADNVVAALWDATMIRRCTGRPGSGSGRCAPAQLGVAYCPCDGSLDPDTYHQEVDRVIHGIDADPTNLLDRLQDRMSLLADRQRYEEAAWVRDRHHALASALERRRRWQALLRLGLFEAAGPDGEHVLVDHGRLITTWRSGQTPPLRLAPPPEPTLADDLAPSVEQADEAELIWKWLMGDGVTLVEATGALSVPLRPVARLAVGPLTKLDPDRGGTGKDLSVA